MVGAAAPAIMVRPGELLKSMKEFDTLPEAGSTKLALLGELALNNLIFVLVAVISLPPGSFAFKNCRTLFPVSVV